MRRTPMEWQDEVLFHLKNNGGEITAIQLGSLMGVGSAHIGQMAKIYRGFKGIIDSGLVTVTRRRPLTFNYTGAEIVEESKLEGNSVKEYELEGKLISAIEEVVSFKSKIIHGMMQAEIEELKSIIKEKDDEIYNLRKSPSFISKILKN